MSDDDPADALISGRSKRSVSYHADYGKKTYGEINRLAGRKPPDRKARQMKKLIENDNRLDEDKKSKPRR